MIKKIIQRASHFQKEFGYEKKVYEAKQMYIKATKRDYIRGVSGAGMFGSMLFVIGLEIINIDTSSWLMKFFYLYKCNISMLFSKRKDIPISSFLDKEKEYNIINWYFHIIILQRLKEQFRSELNKSKIEKGLTSGTINSIRKIIDFYELDKEQAESDELMSELSELLFLVSKSIIKTKEEVSFENLAEIFNFAIENYQAEILMKCLIALQIILQEHCEKFFPYLSNKAMENIINSVNNDNQDLSQGCKDVITYILLNKITKQQLSASFKQEILKKITTETSQDKVIRRFLK
ncbi:unnamed protein product [Blepharisma stoltei]|uniref:Uncharacterized protein n=1 Tax=Blepharisma stoltei TaxID=1481888 RepID=A0AAU9JQ28_9CILI|nr:unnamed protein product [Blepharisma stoltei]